MKYVPNQNGKVLEEALAGFDSDDVKRCENNNEMSALFQNYSPSFASFPRVFPHFSVTLLHTIESIMNSSEG